MIEQGLAERFRFFTGVMGLIQGPRAFLSAVRRRLFRRSSDDDHETSLSYSSESDPSSPHFLTVSIEQPLKGFFCTLKAVGKIDLPPRQVFDILTSSQNPTEVFKSIKRVNYRKPIRDDGNGKKQTEVEHVGLWRFGPLKGEFIVRMMVYQDRNRGSIKFKLLKSSLMKDFSGEWRIEPFDEDSLDEMVRYPGRQWGFGHSLKKAMHRFEEGVFGGSGKSLVQLRQSVQPKFMPPPPFDRVLKQITLWQIKCIIRDLNEEAERVKAGKSTRGGWRIGDGAISSRVPDALSSFGDETLRRWRRTVALFGREHDAELNTVKRTGKDDIEDVTDVETYISNFDIKGQDGRKN